MNFITRTAVAAILIPLSVLVIYLGGWPYQAVILVLLAAAAWEYIKLLKLIDLRPAVLLVMAGVILLVGARVVFGFGYSSAMITALVFLIAFFHILAYERQDSNPAADFGASLSVLVYVGFLGAYLISLRDLPNGRWWTFLALPTCWIADTGAYLIGSAIGKHKLAPKTSPHKTWEGYIAGLIFGLLGSLGLLLLYNRVFEAGLDITYWEAAGLGVALSAFIPLGDLTESMIKRSAGQKDSGVIFPGHGGVFDRIDSMFWAAPLAYYLIQLLFL